MGAGESVMWYVVQVRRVDSERWHRVCEPWADWQALNSWLGANWWVWPLGRYERRIVRCKSTESTAAR